MQIWYRVMTQPPCASVDPLDDALLTSAPLLAPQSPIRPPPAPGPTGVARVTPGVGGCNIVLPPSGTTVATQDALHRSSLNDLEPRPRPLIKIETTVAVWIGRASFIGNMLLVIPIIGFMTLAPHDDVSKPTSDMQSVMMPSHERTAKIFSHPLRLIVERQQGFTNELLPLGISLEDISGGETVTLKGLVRGVEVSLGTSLGLDGWRISAVDLDKTWVSAPEGFVGAMDATVNLYSADGKLLQSKAIQFEWISRKEERLTKALSAFEPPPELRPLDADKIAILSKLGRRLLQDGEIAAARLILKRAARAGDAQASLALGMTFDPNFVAQWGVLPDVTQASNWYERANKLGSIEALRHYERLDQAHRSGRGPASPSDLSHQ
jgi:hypothetical protein